MNIIFITLLAFPLLAGNNSNPEKESEEAVSAFRTVYFAKDADNLDQLVAIQQLANIPHPATARELGKLLFTAPDEHRIEASIALGSYHDIRGTSVLLTGAILAPGNRKKTQLRVALVDSLASLLDLGSLPILHLLIGEKELPVALAAIKAVPSFERRESVATLNRHLKLAEQTRGSAAVERRFTLERALKALNKSLAGK